MYREIRRCQIIEFLKTRGTSSVNELARLFETTGQTIRSDLNYLQGEGFVIRHHGGVSIKKHLLQEDLVKSGTAELSSRLPGVNTSIATDYKYKGLSRMTVQVCVFGSFNVDIVAKVNRFPLPGETVIASGSSVGPGGKGGNQAFAASAAGASVHFATKLGKDQFNQFARSHIETSTLTSHSIFESEKEPTGSAVIYVNSEAENKIAITPGANHDVSHEEIASLMPYIAESKVLLVQLENNIEATLQAANVAKELGIAVIVNPAPYRKEVESLLPYTDIITPNETEASEMSGVVIKDLETAKEAAQIIHAKHVKSVIITMGKRGLLIYEGDKFMHIPAFHAVPVDTTGAGDAFNGALSSSIAMGKPLIQAALYANAFASLAVEREGAANMPTVELVEARMMQQTVTAKQI
ncbi:PfkB family carbohydrate kinase [Photobacterium rosenbergii]|uniref:PfkB family carbohydrate kinase n=1 Tax=Photobacterium rosenbergii TaxID=294936 RepID=UPI001C99204C|nr:ribokinase [Photobacterium rosenbergii]MBY5948442.1 bifunctional hydroxymethylpyrimidine kinase/phosphomethylpyrimidine kinase [Photobacterium rosenbergii]